MKYLADYIGSDFKEWKNETILFDCGTGCGKTHFCINVLGKYANENNKRILILTNRMKLRQQIQVDLVNVDSKSNIDVYTYQALESILAHNDREIERYDYIIADECHYFINDAKFNRYTDLSYSYIKERIEKKDCVVILMSATCKVWFKWLKDNDYIKERNYYYVKRDYSYIQDVYFYNKTNLFQLINNILYETNDKIIVFCSGERVIEAYEEYGKTAGYYYSEYSTNNKLNKIPKMYDPVPLKHRVLFTTIALDNGINVEDNELHHIFCEVFEPETLIQCIGRKRVSNPDDWCNVYIKEFGKKGMNSVTNFYKKQLDLAEQYLKDKTKFIEEYHDNRFLEQNEMFYFKSKSGNMKFDIILNNLIYVKYVLLEAFVIKIREQGYKLAILNELDEQFRLKVKSISNIDKEYIDFVDFLKLFINKRLYTEERSVIKDKFKKVFLKRDNGIKTFNAILEENYSDVFPYRFYNRDDENNYLIDGKRSLDDGTKNPHHGHKYWILKKIE